MKRNKELIFEFISILGAHVALWLGLVVCIGDIAIIGF